MDLVPVLVAVWTAEFGKILKNRGIPRNLVTGNQKPRAVRLSPVLKTRGPRTGKSDIIFSPPVRFPSGAGSGPEAVNDP